MELVICFHTYDKYTSKDIDYVIIQLTPKSFLNHRVLISYQYIQMFQNQFRQCCTAWESGKMHKSNTLCKSKELLAPNPKRKTPHLLVSDGLA